MAEPPSEPVENSLALVTRTPAAAARRLPEPTQFSAIQVGSAQGEKRRIGQRPTLDTDSWISEHYGSTLALMMLRGQGYARDA